MIESCVPERTGASRKLAPVPAGKPVVSVGIPTYNRAKQLERAVRSVLAQDHADLEVIVSDDASSDETPSVGAALAAGDERVRFVSQPANLGHASNYDWVLRAARGEYFMWLSDDDWLEPRYVSECLAALRADAGTVLVCGRARYLREGAEPVDERPIDLLASSPGQRVVRYFSRVSVNGPLFGLMRRSELSQVGFPDVLGGDWLLVATMAARGRVRTLRDVRINRSFSGLGTDAQALARSFGARGLRARQHHLWVAWTVPRAVPVGPVATLLSSLLILMRFSAMQGVRAVLRVLRLSHLEDRATAWVRARER
jgi:hypothetical protein